MFKYDAFVSYRHVHPDMEIAREVQRLIESFVVSKGVPDVPKRRDFLVFRDRDELASGELGEAIENALENSAFLVVLCSKRTPLSPWCRREIEYFREVRDPSNIIAVLVEGEPEESFPPELKDVTKLVRMPDGTHEERRGEFLAADVRPEEVRAPDFPGYERVEGDAGTLGSLRRKSVAILRRTEINRIMATVLGVSYGDITQRQRERKTRRLVVTISAVALVLGVFAATVTAMWIKSMRAEKRTAERNASIVMNLASQAIDGGDRLLGILYSRAAMESADPSMGDYDRLRGEYYSNLSAASLYGDYTPLVEIATASGVTSYGQNFAGDQLVTAGKGRDLTVWDADNGTPVRSVALSSKPIGVGSARDGSVYYALGEDNRIYVTPTAGGKVSSIRTGISSQVNDLMVWKDHALVSVADGTSARLVGIDFATGRQTFSMSLSNETTGTIDLRADGGEFAVSYRGGGAARYDARTGAELAWIVDRQTDAPSIARSGSQVGHLGYSFDGRTLVYVSGNDYYRVDTSDGSTTRNAIDNPLVGRDRRILVRGDGNAVYMATPGTGGVYRVDLASPNSNKLFASAQKVMSKMTLTPDGKSLAVLTKDNSLLFWRGLDSPDLTDPSKPAPRPSGETGPFDSEIVQMSFSRDGKRVFLVGEDASVRIVRTEGTERTTAGTGVPTAKSNDGKTLYSVTPYMGYVKTEGSQETFEEVSSIGQWAAVSNDGRCVTGIKRNTKSVIVTGRSCQSYVVGSDVLSSNGRGPLVAFGRGRDVIFAAADGSVVRHDWTGRLTRYGGESGAQVRSVRVSADGSLVAVSRRGKGYEVYSVTSGRRLFAGRGEAIALAGAKGKVSCVLAIDGEDVVRYDSRGSQLTRARIPQRLLSQLETGAVRDGSADGSQLALSANANDVAVIDARSGVILRTIKTKATSPAALFVGDGLAYQAQADSGLTRSSYRRTGLYDPADLEKLADKTLAGRRLTLGERAEIGQ